jgi:hypothetical protein
MRGLKQAQGGGRVSVLHVWSLGLQPQGVNAR